MLGGRFGEEPRRLSFQRLDRFAESGGRLVDTAHCYADGRSERVIGEWMRANPAVLAVADKIGHPANGAVDLSAARLRRELTESCERLGVACVEAVLLHRDEPERAVPEVAESLAGLVRDGHTHRIGVSNWPASRLEQLVDELAGYGHRPLVSYQRSLAAPTTPLWPGALHTDDAVQAVAARHELTLLAWAAHARGFFTGATEPPTPGGGDPFDSAPNRARRGRCRELARRCGERPETVALAWLLHQPATWAVIGPRSVTELDTSLRAARLPLDAGTLRWLAEPASDGAAVPAGRAAVENTG
ncbi:aldo/keto reductase [Plantactinospora sp. WMMB782]|uniref:aldo/keto reductase n=1 Tax=Plantactinospora sp. WMMB782 TaxID=3404121 RepID=UPI003B922B5A